MARETSLDKLVYYAVLFGGVYLVYRLGLQGALGAEMQRAMQEIQRALPFGGAPPTGGARGAAGGTGSGAVGLTIGPTTLSPQYRQLLGANPNFYQQAVEWRAARCLNRENPNDWAAFRRHLLAIGAPDAGPVPPPEWPDHFGGPLVC